jgi:signal transduction histidine kinase
VCGLVYTMVLMRKQNTERDRLFSELEAAHEQLRLASAHEAELAALRERNRLAREMHDSLGHALVLIAIKIEAAQRLQAVAPGRAAQEWEDTKALVRSTMTELRHSLAGLRLPALEERPLRAALLDMTFEVGRTAHVDITSDVSSTADDFDRDTQETIYRVAQEGLANVAKHARAQRAWLTLTVDARCVSLTVADDGIGLAAAPRNTAGHYGVRGMRERIEALHGILTLGPRLEGGTVLQAEIPLREAASVGHSHSAG